MKLRSVLKEIYLKELLTPSLMWEAFYFLYHLAGTGFLLYLSRVSPLFAALLYHLIYPMDFAIQHDVCHGALKLTRMFKCSTFFSSMLFFPETFNYCIGHLNHHKHHSDSAKLESDVKAIQKGGTDLFRRKADVDLRFALAQKYEIREARSGQLYPHIVYPYNTWTFWLRHVFESLYTTLAIAPMTHLKIVYNSVASGSPTAVMLSLNLACNIILALLDPRHVAFLFCTRAFRLERLMPMWLFRRMTHFNKDFFSSHGFVRPSSLPDEFSFLDECFPSEDWSVPWMLDRFLMCGLTYHSTHHLFPRCPFYGLASTSHAWKSALAQKMGGSHIKFPLFTWFSTGICRQVDSHDHRFFRFACYVPP